MFYDPPPQPNPSQDSYPPQGYTQHRYPPPSGAPSANWPQQPTARYGGLPPVAAGTRLDIRALWKKLEPPGLACSISGLVLFCSFFLPWFNVSELCSGECFGYRGYIDAANGFTVAQDGIEGFHFTLLWLIVIESLLLIALPVVPALGKLTAKRTWLLILGVVGVAIVVELIYLLNAFGALPGSTGTFSAGHTTITLTTGPSFGFWLGLLATLIVGGIAFFLLRFKKSAGVSSQQLPIRSQASRQNWAE
jgi:hypothetical protein